MTAGTSERAASRLREVVQGMISRLATPGPQRQAALFTMGTLLATALVGVAKFALARRIPVEEFGSVALTLSVLQFTALFVDLGLFEPVSRLIARSPIAQRGGMVYVGLLVYIPVGAFFVALVFGLSFVADSIFEQQIGEALRVLAPVAAVWPFTAFIGLMIARARDRLGAAAMASSVGQAFVLLVILVAVKPDTGVIPVLFIFAAGNWIAALLLLKWLGPERRQPGPAISAIRRARKAWGFRAYIGRVMSIGTYNLDVLMLGAFASGSAVANYTLTGALAAAVGVPAVAYATAHYSRMAHAERIGRRTFLTVAGLSVAVAPITVLSAAVVVAFVLPSTYQPMILLAIPLGLAQALRSLTSPLNIFLVSHGRGREQLWQGGILASSNVILNFALIPPFGAQGAAWASAGALFTNLIAYIWLYRRTIADEVRSRSDLGQPVDDAGTAGDLQAPVDVPGRAPISPQPQPQHGRVVSSLIRIGPHPLTALRMAGNRLAKRRRHAAIRADYEKEIIPPIADVALRPFPVRFPTSRDHLLVTTDAAERLRHFADEALAHRTDLLGAVGAFVGSPVAWHRDAKTGDEWDPARLYLDVVVTRTDDGSDAKMPWELSRSHHILGLARAARLFDDRRYADEAKEQLLGWLDANPPGHGINWVNAMEVAIRAINWIWALETLPDGMGLNPADQERVVQSLRTHASHIASNLEGSPLIRGNHYLADRVGQFIISSVLEDDPLASRWQRDSRESLEEEILKQVHPDGFNFEASTAYHGLGLELFLLAFLVSTWFGPPFSERYRSRLEAMVEASFAIRRPDGRIPLFGDNDSARVIPLDDDRTATHDPLLWLAAGVIGTPGPPTGEPSPEVAWTAGVAAWDATNSIPRAEAKPYAELPDGGIWVLRNDEDWVAIRCGDVGQGGTGGHAHNDALSFEYSRDGLPVVVDPGTFVYTADPDLRNGFRSTAFHSTLTLDAQEINPIDPGKLFNLRQVAWPRCTEFEPTSSEPFWVGYHDGWMRLEQQATHTRRVSLRATGGVDIRDRIDGLGRARVCASLPLAPGVVASVQDGRVTIEQPVALTLEVEGDELEVSLETIEIAECYGRRHTSSVIRIRSDVNLPCEFRVAFVPQTQLAQRPTGSSE